MTDTIGLAGKKRKRQSVEVDVGTRVVGKFYHYQKEVRKASKKAKAFEIQKLVKRLKTLRKSNNARGARASQDDLQTTEHQIEALKNMDLDLIAHIALRKKVHKDKLLSSNDAILSALSSFLDGSASTITSTEAYKKVQARLLSSKLLAAEVNSAIDHLKGFVDPSLRLKKRESLDVRSYGDIDHEKDDQINGEEDDESNDITSTSKNFMLDETDDMIDNGGWESGSIHGSESDEEGTEKGDQNSDDVSLEDNEDQRSDSSLEDNESERSDSEPASKKPRERSSKEKGQRTLGPALTSTFLPSLSVGFVPGDSDSAGEFDSEGETASRKNRRGQRARQAIWAKKYGKGAKHVKKKQEEIQSRAMAKSLGKRQDKGWPAKARLSESTKSAFVKQGSTTRNGAGDELKKSTSSAVDKPVHPSWEAKKRLKEKEQRILPIQGKKIVFT